jgi:DnaJ-class molecular chaperone
MTCPTCHGKRKVNRTFCPTCGGIGDLSGQELIDYLTVKSETPAGS